MRTKKDIIRDGNQSTFQNYCPTCLSINTLWFYKNTHKCSECGYVGGGITQEKAIEKVK